MEKDEEYAKSKWRFVPDAFPKQRLRLTEAHQGVGNFWTMEIDLKPYAKKGIKVEGFNDSEWVWMAEIIQGVAGFCVNTIFSLVQIEIKLEVS